MKTIRIIDLLNKISNGEEVPLKIKYPNKEKEYIYDLNIQDYRCDDTLIFNTLFSKYRTNFFINDEVEIIEEQKSDMQKLKQDLERVTKVFYKAWEPVKEQFAELFGILQKNKLLEEGNQIESIDVEYYKTNDERYNELLEEIASFQEWCIDKINSLEKEQ